MYSCLWSVDVNVVMQVLHIIATNIPFEVTVGSRHKKSKSSLLSIVNLVTPRLDSHSTIKIEESEIESEVLAITSVTSEKFVAAPNKVNVIGDLLIGLKRFRNATRWKAFFHDKNKE